MQDSLLIKMHTGKHIRIKGKAHKKEQQKAEKYLTSCMLITIQMYQLHVAQSPCQRK